VYENFSQPAIDSFITTNPPLLTFDKTIINEYAELCRSRNLRQQLINSKLALELGTKIIEQLTKQYHLK
jgi:hypothetical protein